MQLSVLSSAIQSGASDVHIEPGEVAGRVRFRLDGRMVPVEDQVSPQVLRQIGSRLKVMADLDITDFRRPPVGSLCDSLSPFLICETERAWTEMGRDRASIHSVSASSPVG